MVITTVQTIDAYVLCTYMIVRVYQKGFDEKDMQKKTCFLLKKDNKFHYKNCSDDGDDDDDDDDDVGDDDNANTGWPQLLW